jgi:nicotinamidase-related amidase
VIDIQNNYMAVPSSTAEQKRWAPFFDRMNNIVIPNTRALVDLFRKHGVERLFARIACLKADGRDRSLSQ